MCAVSNRYSRWSSIQIVSARLALPVQERVEVVPDERDHFPLLQYFATVAPCLMISDRRLSPVAFAGDSGLAPQRARWW